MNYQDQLIGSKIDGSIGANPALPGPMPNDILRQIIRDELSALWTGQSTAGAGSNQRQRPQTQGIQAQGVSALAQGVPAQIQGIPAQAQMQGLTQANQAVAYPYAPQPLPSLATQSAQASSPAMVIAYEQLKQSMEQNLQKLRTVIEETRLIAQQMEELLNQTSDDSQGENTGNDRWMNGEAQRNKGENIQRRKHRQSGNA